MSSADVAMSGLISFASADERERLAIEIAGLLAESSIQRLTIADPRMCRTRDIAPRETNLPRELIDAAPGTTFAGDGVALLIDDTCIRWVATANIAVGLLSTRPG